MCAVSKPFIQAVKMLGHSIECFMALQRFAFELLNLLWVMVVICSAVLDDQDELHRLFPRDSSFAFKPNFLNALLSDLPAGNVPFIQRRALAESEIPSSQFTQSFSKFV